MLTIYDKVQWHIDAGEDSSLVISKMKVLFAFLNANQMLNSDGLEIMDIGIDDSTSIHENMVTDEGKKFMERFYDKVINLNPAEMLASLEQMLKEQPVD